MGLVAEDRIEVRRTVPAPPAATVRFKPTLGILEPYVP